MKKLISKPNTLALLLLGLASSAHAQSSVTLFGLLDANIGRYKGAAAGVTPADTTITRQDASGLSTSYFGVRGTEDLGGGLSANFELQSFIRNDTGQPGRSDAICAGPPAPAPACSAVNVGADPFWSKAAFVGLGSNTLGRVRLGQITTAIFISSTSSNAFGDSTSFSPINLLMFIGSPLAGGTGWSNSIAYDSPSLGGFNFNLQKSLSEGSGGGNVGGRVAYAGGPFTASLAYSDVKKDPITFSDGTTSNNTKNTLAGVSYDFQTVKLFGHLGQIKSDGSATATTADDNITHKVWDISALVPVGAGRVMVGYGSRKGDERFASKRSLASVGYAYSLSKRTDLYVLLRNDRNRAAGTVAPAVEARGTSYALGVRHFF
ncbi:porin [Variovorax terrae]|uniref:Porin n=1 Tax=Variovorax terrae TaxID=2923278 RepID=A0A9X2AS58_9BURK|nr:porin [Variovorax terrae]MCJ0764916.1 porin [Variovorax terrae]